MADDDRDVAVIRIQRAWRRHIDIQVFKYYRDLINFKQKGDPSAILKCINPIEAKLLDAASGAHVKFRLAGEKFPPNIYYKIFTHRPVQDLCANSPKDYTAAESKLKDCREVHNRVNIGEALPLNPSIPFSKPGWYQRCENNGWRLVSDRMLSHLLTDPVTFETSKKAIYFHHNKLQRAADLQKKRKVQKIEWLRKMHAQGMLRAKASVDPETSALVEGAAAGMLSAAEQYGADQLEDWEVNELLQWTTGLNYDEYVDDWKCIATSAGSEDRVELRAHLYTDDVVFEMDVPQRQIQTGYSHNTPVANSRLSSAKPAPAPEPAAT